jgi:hypothetical protein
MQEENSGPGIGATLPKLHRFFAGFAILPFVDL